MNLYEKVTNSILQDMTKYLNSNQLVQLKFVLDLELSKVKIEKCSTELSLPINNDELLKEYVGSMLVGGRRESSVKRYKYILDKLTSYIDKDFINMTTQDIKYFLAIYKTQRHCSNTTVENMRLCISAFFKWLLKEEYISKNPVEKIPTIKKDTQPERALYGYEMELLRQSCTNIRNRAILEFLYSTACRVSEIVKIKITEVNFDKKCCVVHGKGNKDRIVYFSDECFVYLKEYLRTRNDDDIDILFKSTRANKGLSVDAIQCMLTDIGKRANVDNVHPHRFRVTRITNLIDKGMAIQNVQKLVGHSNIKTTETYYRSNMNDVEYEYFKYC